MNRRPQRNSRKNDRVRLPWWVWAMAFLSLWLILSIFSEKSPIHTLTDGFRSVTGKPLEYKSPKQILVFQQQYQDSLQRLQTEIETLKNATPYRKAMVNTEANSLNVRSSANITSEVVVKIPDSSIVEVIYFDEEVLVLEGETGKWCKIKYADKEGWVWGNYVKLLD